MNSEISDVLTQLEESIIAMKYFDKRGLTELKSFINPPEAVRIVFYGCVILFEDELKKSGVDMIYFQTTG